MKIHFEDKGQTRLINVIAFTGQDRELEYLKSLLSQVGFKQREIYIYDTDVLPAKAIYLIVHFMALLEIQVFIHKKYLQDYLIMLGIYTTLIQDTQKNELKIVDNIKENIKCNFISEDVKLILENIYNQYGYDFRSYQSDSITRRICSYVYKEKKITLKEFTQDTIEKKEGIHEILSGLTVKTTEFFRDGQVYKILRNKILNYLNSYTSIKIWCAGCSTGEEAYSIAIILEEAGMLEKSLIYATDLSFNSIQRAKNGLYNSKEIKEADKAYIDSGGRSSLQNCFMNHGSFSEIKSQYKERVLFFQHSLVDSGVLNEFQLIFCRNVLMYFNNHLQKKTLKLLQESLDISGFLFLGKSEGILVNGGSKYFIESDAKNKIYRRKSQ